MFLEQKQSIDQKTESDRKRAKGGGKQTRKTFPGAPGEREVGPARKMEISFPSTGNDTRSRAFESATRLVRVVIGSRAFPYRGDSLFTSLFTGSPPCRRTAGETALAPWNFLPGVNEK